MLEDHLDKVLGLGARHEHGGLDLDIERVELPLSEDVGDGLVLEAALDVGVERGQLGLLIEAGVQLGPGHAEDMGEHEFGVVAGGLAHVGEGADGGIEALAYGRHQVAANFATRSASIRASMTGCKYPSMTFFNWWCVKPMR